MANSIDIGINFVEPNDDGKKREIEPQSEKPKKTSSKGKSSTGPSATQLNQEQLSRIKELEAKYKKGKITGPEAAEYLKLANVKVGEGLKELLSKGDSWVGGKEILRGKALQRIQDRDGRRGHPNEIKNRLKAQMTKAMDKAAKNILSQVVDTQPSPDIVADVTNQAIEQALEEKAEKAKAIAKGKALATAKRQMEGVNAGIRLDASTKALSEMTSKVEDKPMASADTIAKLISGSLPKESSDIATDMSNKTAEAAVHSYKISGSNKAKQIFKTALDQVQKYLGGNLNLEDYQVKFGKKFSKADLPSKATGNVYGKEIFLRDVGSTSKSLSEFFPNKTEGLTEEDVLNATIHELVHVWQEQNDVFEKNKFLDLPYHLRPTEINARYVADYISNMSKLPKEEFDKYFKPEHLTPEWATEFSKKKMKERMASKVEEKPIENKLQSETVAPTPVTSSKIPPSKKTASNKPKDIFSYATEENVQQFEEQESKRKQEQASRQKEAEDKARKMVEDAIMPVEDSLKDINDAIAKIGTGAGSGDGGKGKGPKAPPGFGDDDDMGDDGDIGDGFDPFPTLRARIENLQRTFKSTLYAEKDANLFSSLQKTFEKGRRAEDLDIVQKNVEEEVRAQMKLLLAFETRNENLRNSLEATLIEKIRKEIDKPQEKQNRPAFEWLVGKLKEVQESREKIKSEFDKIETEITSTISERATSGFVQGKIERDIRQMEVQGKEEDKIIDTYMKEFSKYVKAEYKQIAKKQAFEVGRQTMEANKDKMKSSELLKKMKVAYDKEFTRVMDTIPTETELTREEILAAHEAGQGKFAPEAFRPKGASPEYASRQPSATGGSGGTGGPGTPTATAGEPEDVPPSRENLSAILPPPKVDMDKVRENFARWALIKEATKPMVSASTPQGTTGSEVFGTAAAVGGGALALGVISGPIAAMAVGITQMTGILAQIAENTAKEVTPFSPELIMAKVEQSLTRLNINMAIANASGRDLANYQKSSNLLSNQLYELGVDIWDTSDKQVTFLIDALSFIISILRIFIIIGSAIWKIQEVVLYPIYISVRQLAKTGEFLTNLLSGRKTATVRDYTEDFMANDLRPRNNNRNE